MKIVKDTPPVKYDSRRSEWLDRLFDGRKRELGPEDWHEVNPETGKPRYKDVRSASSAIKQAAEGRGISAADIEVSIRGDLLYVQVRSNGTGKAPAKKVAKKAVAKKAPAKSTPTRKAAAAKAS